MPRSSPAMRSLLDRLEDKFVVKTDGCWDWIAARSEGYGRFWLNGAMRLAHRAVYELLEGPIPEGLDLDHLCRNHSCVNPGHLEPVTRRENLLRGEGVVGINARKTHCPYGHPYTEENTYYKAPTKRECRACWPRLNKENHQRRRLRQGLQ